MSKRLSVLVSVVCLLLVVSPFPALSGSDDKVYVADPLAPEWYLEKAAYKLVRGVTNIVTSPAEIPKQLVVTTRSHGAIGPVLGLFKGLGMTVARIAIGVGETATFFLPNNNDGSFDPILKPEYVWDSSPAN